MEGSGSPFDWTRRVTKAYNNARIKHARRISYLCNKCAALIPCTNDEREVDDQGSKGRRSGMCCHDADLDKGSIESALLLIRCCPHRLDRPQGLAWICKSMAAIKKSG